MIVGIIIGRRNSKGFPGKNMHRVLGKPLAFYPLYAVKNCPEVDRAYISTDDERLMELARGFGFEIIKRPLKLCSDKALGEDVFVHAYNTIKTLHHDINIELFVLLMCNAPSITSQTISEGIKTLRQRPEYDSAVTVSKYNMWGPIRARKIDRDGLLHPFLPFKVWQGNNKFNCDRDSQGDIWFADMGVSIVRPRCLENIKNGLLPQRWMGKKIYPLKQWGGLDIDYDWQIPMAEYWLKKNLKRGK